MSIRDRLNRLSGENASVAKGDLETSKKREMLGDLRKRIDAVIERRPAQEKRMRVEALRTLAELLPDSEEITTASGPVFVIHGRHHRGVLHGRKRIGELAHLDTRHAALLAGHPSLLNYNLQDALFLDTETTGLSGGTGTLAFLIGLGWYDGDAFITRQLFARDFSEEAALLDCLTGLAQDKRFLVTFNGKAFDINLLSTRFILNRMKDPLSAMPHLDLLHPSRRLIGHRLENSRLVTIEEKILGHSREGDIPGSEIPQRYFDWLRSKNPMLLTDIIEHNRLDVLSMALLLLHLCEIIHYGTEAEGVCPADVLAASRLCWERGETDRCVQMLQTLIDSEEPEYRSEARLELSLILKRSGQWPQAVALWEQVIATDPKNLFALVELAKWFEHRKRDFGRAAELVSIALEGGVMGEERDGLLHRLERIERRAALGTPKRGRAKKTKSLE